MFQFFFFAVALASPWDLARAEELNLTALKWDVLKIDGPYYYDSDGVPLLGWIVARLPDDNVQFLLCSNKVVKISSKSLKAANEKCAKKQRLITPWAYDSLANKIVSVAKIDNGGSIEVIAHSQNTPKIGLMSLPTSYQDSIVKAKTGDWVAITFTAASGKKSLGIVEPTR
jgi:hypothetical protein